jgi:hypothetical protein
MKPKLLFCIFTLACLASTIGLQAVDPKTFDRPGYTDTPMLPDGKWRVHDSARPYPKVVDPGPIEKQKGFPFAPPEGAIVLFDGKDLSQWTGKGGKASWKVENGYFEVNRTGGINTKEKFKDFKLHIEWSSPKEVKGDSQGRGNSGVFLQGAYEVQVLDSYKNPTYADGQAASMYGQYPPEVNACRKPGAWQSYDVTFRSARFGKDGKLKKPAVVTVVHNGVTVHDKREYMGTSTHKKVGNYNRKVTEGPISLQDHGNPVRFRNVWLKKL